MLVEIIDYEDGSNKFWYYLLKYWTKHGRFKISICELITYNIIFILLFFTDTQYHTKISFDRFLFVCCWGISAKWYCLTELIMKLNDLFYTKPITININQYPLFYC